MTAVITALFSSAGALVLQKNGCQTSRHLAAARRASQLQLLDVGDGPNGAGGWENRKRLRRNAEMRRRRGEKREERRVSGGGEKKPRRLTAQNDGFRHRKSPGNKQNSNENHPAPKQKTLPKSRRPILAESKKLPILPAGDANHLYDRAPGPPPSIRLWIELLVNWPLTE
jgi:hypothetical protein